MKLPIYIPTLGRDRVYLLEQLEDHLHAQVTLVTNRAQLPALQAKYPRVNVVACPWTREPGQPKADGIKFGIAPTRQWMAEHAYRKGNRYLLMSDDDLCIYVRRNRKDLTDWHARRATSAEVTVALKDMERLTESEKKYAVVGMSAKQGNNRHTERTSEAKRIWNFWAVDVFRMHQLKIRMDAVPVMEDFWVQLNFLTRGWPTIQINDFMHCQGKSNAPGGCSLFRTNAHQEAATKKLIEHFPDFIKPRKVKTKHGWFGEERTDVTFYGKKALEFGMYEGGALL